MAFVIAEPYTIEPMKATEPGPIAIPPEIAAKCDGPDQFENFDRLFRSVIAVPKTGRGWLPGNARDGS